MFEVADALPLTGWVRFPGGSRFGTRCSRWVPLQTVEVGEGPDPEPFAAGSGIADPAKGIFREEDGSPGTVFVGHSQAPEDHRVRGIHEKGLAEGSFGLAADQSVEAGDSLLEPALSVRRVGCDGKVDRADILALDGGSPRAP